MSSHIAFYERNPETETTVSWTDDEDEALDIDTEKEPELPSYMKTDEDGFLIPYQNPDDESETDLSDDEEEKQEPTKGELVNLSSSDDEEESERAYAIRSLDGAISSSPPMGGSSRKRAREDETPLGTTTIPRVKKARGEDNAWQQVLLFTEKQKSKRNAQT